jgi:hypothetical protein
MDGFSGYNQIEIILEDQHKTTFIFPWGTFAYRKLPLALKMLVQHSSEPCPMPSMTLNISYSHIWMTFPQNLGGAKIIQTT